MARRAPAAKAPDKALDEQQLVEAAQRDPALFADLYEQHFAGVYAFVARRVRDRETAQDLTADVFHKALASIGRFEWRGAPFSAWLFRIAANAVIDHGQRSARERAASATDQPSEISVEEAQHRARLFELVDLLPIEQRRVIVMRFAEQKSIREIAGEIGRTEGAVKQLQFRGLENLRARMGEKHA